MLLTGAPGSGKSTWALTLCGNAIEEGYKVMYLDRDNGLHTAQNRIQRVFPKERPKELLYWGLWTTEPNSDTPMEPPVAKDDQLFNTLHAFVVKHPKMIVFIDTLAAFSDCDENDNNAINATFKQLRRLTSLGCTTFVIHHTTKNGQSDYRGASSMAGAIDVGLRVESAIVDGKIATMELHTFKTRMGDGQTIFYKMVGGIPQRVNVTSDDRLYETLQSNPGLSKEKFTDLAMEKFGYRRGTVRSFLDHGIVAGMIRYEKQKLYPATEMTQLQNQAIYKPATKADPFEFADDDIRWREAASASTQEAA